MKHFTVTCLLTLSCALITTNVMAAKETFDRSKPHLAELAKIEQACKSKSKKCEELKKAYKKKYNKEPNLRDYNSSRSNNSSSRAQDYNSSRSNNSSSKAQDYNSSRSNTTSVAKDMSEKFDKKSQKIKVPRDAASGMATGKRQHAAITIPKEDCVNSKVVRGKHKDKKCEHRGHVAVLK